MRNSILYKTVSTPLILVAMLLAIAIAAHLAGSGPFSRTIVEMFIRVMLVVGLYIFIGNSGIISFGHIGFMCIGAYATAWFTIPPMMKKYQLARLIFGNARSLAPIISGTRKFPSTAGIEGIRKKKIIITPCSVKRRL